MSKRLPVATRIARAWRLFLATLADPTGLERPRQWLVDWVRGDLESAAGEAVTPETSLALAAVWYAVNRIAGDVGQLPLLLYERTPGVNRDNRDRAKAEPAYNIMRKRPNEDMTASVFRETLTAHALLRGNGYGYIDRHPMTGRLRGVWPLPLDSTFPFRVFSEDREDWRGELWYKTTVYDASGRRVSFVSRPEEIFHLRGLAWDGLQGHSVIRQARQSFGLALAAERHGARFFSNAAQPGLILEAPPDVLRTPEEREQFLAEWKKQHQGADAAHKTSLLAGGIKANVISITNEDSQWLESRKFQRVEVALWFGLEYITGDDSSVSYNSLEQKGLAYLQGTLQRWLTRWQEECDAKLLTEKQKEQDSHYFEFLTAALLKGSLLDRYRAYEIGRRNEWLSADDVRELENLNERPDGNGNEYINPNVRAAPQSGGDGVDQAPQPGAAAPLSPRALVRSRLEALYGEERRRVLRASRQSKAFLSWADRFYREWGLTFAATLAELGATQEMIDREVGRSQADILEAAARAKPGGLAAAVETATADWSERPARLTDAILRHTSRDAA